MTTRNKGAPKRIVDGFFVSLDANRSAGTDHRETFGDTGQFVTTDAPMAEASVRKPQPPKELSIAEEVRKDWDELRPNIEANRNHRIEITAICQRLQHAERLHREGRTDPRYDWSYDIDNARYIHERLLQWAELVEKENTYSAEYWRDLAQRQMKAAYDYVLMGMNFIVLFNGGVAIGCLSGIVSERAERYESVFKWGIGASFLGLLLCLAAIACTSEWLSHSSTKISNKLIRPPTSNSLKAIPRYAARYHRIRGVWIDRLHWIASGWFFFYLAVGIIGFLNC